MVRLRQWTTALFPFVLSLAACSESVGPRPGVTLLVRNENCQLHQCTPVRVFGFPSGGPHTPGGPWAVELGTVDRPSACFTLPESATRLIIAVANDGTADTTAYTWSSDQPLALGVEPGSGPGSWPAPSTGDFVPTNAKGWSVTLPGPGDVASAPACEI